MDTASDGKENVSWDGVESVDEISPDPTKSVRQVQSWTRRFNGRQRFGCRSVTTLRVSFRFMAPTALKPHLIVDDDNSLD